MLKDFDKFTKCKMQSNGISEKHNAPIEQIQLQNRFEILKSVDSSVKKYLYNVFI